MNKKSKKIRIEPTENGWIVSIQEFEVSKGGDGPVTRHVFTSNLDLQRFLINYIGKLAPCGTTWVAHHEG